VSTPPRAHAARHAAHHKRLRVYGAGWFAGAPLAAAALYALALLGPPLMALSLAYWLRFATTYALSDQLAEVARLLAHKPQPWAHFAVGDGILGVSFLNAWVLFREKRAAAGAAWCVANALLGMAAGRCGGSTFACGACGCASLPCMRRHTQSADVSRARCALRVARAVCTC
jgi:hypothetical protein